MNSQDFQKNKLPTKPGVYFFKKGKQVLYIGKATNLYSRARSYFSSDLREKRGVIIAEMIERADKIEWQETDSVLEALILEASLIKKYQPKYNTKEKSDKSYNYIVITNEEFPKILIKRGREIQNLSITKRLSTTRLRLGVKEKTHSGDLKVFHNQGNALGIFGPFPCGGMLREALKIIRKIFPFSDKCTPLSSKFRKSCFNRQIGLCPGVCSGEISKREYRKIITNIKMFLSGKKVGLVKKLEREMRACAKKKEFEKAEKLKRQIFALNHIQDIALLKENKNSNHRHKNNFRIEGYDVAHLSGDAKLGVMIVIENGDPNKSEYRKFKIKTVKGVDDIASLKETLERRFVHTEWKYPDLIVVDGGKAQKNSAERFLQKIGVQIPIVAVVKDEKHKAKEILGKKELINKYEKEILFVNIEAHRFSLVEHRKIMRKSLLFNK